MKRGAWLVALVLSLWIHGPAEGGTPEAALWVTRVSGRPLSMPNDVAVDRRGVVFLLDSGSRSIVLFSQGGQFIREISGRGVWKDPMALSVSHDGVVFLADGDGGRILEIAMSGKILREYPLEKNGRATGVGVSGDTVFCVDNRNAAVVAFRRGGGRTLSWGKRGSLSGEFQSPFRLAVDAGGRVFVTDVMNARVQWFSAFGQHLGTLKNFGAARGKIFRPTGIAIDVTGKIWIGDSFTGLVQLFDENGSFIRALGVDAGRSHVFGDPIGLAEAPQGLWVVDQREEKAALFRR